MKVPWLALLAVLATPALVLALGADHPRGPVPKQGSWPEGLEPLVNCKERVHGYFVNAEDVFFFRGDTRALNDFLLHYSLLKDTKLVVVLHPGPGEARSPWDKGSRGGADWGLYFAPRDFLRFAKDRVKKGDPKTISRVDVWLGNSVRLADLLVPGNVTVEAGREIEDFIRRHERKGQP